MSMHSTHEWFHNSKYNMSMAQDSHSRATRQREDSHRAHGSTVGTNMTSYEQVAKAVDEKVNTSQRVLEMLIASERSLDSTRRKAQESQNRLEMALRDKDAPLQLCMWRMEQRERRPLREQVRDDVELALEEERACLADTQRKLGKAIRQTKDIIVDLDNSLLEVRNDVEQKKQALSVDEACMRNTRQSHSNAIELTPPAAHYNNSMYSSNNTMQYHRHKIVAHASSKNEMTRVQDAERLRRKLANQEEGTKRVMREHADLMSNCHKAVEKAREKTERRFQDRISENKQMRKRLEEEIRDTNSNIEFTKITISDTKHQLHALEEPTSYSSTCQSWRQARATREHITDPVSARLQEHRMNVHNAQNELVSHHQSEKSNLRELMERRKMLNDDLRDKTSALSIDSECLSRSMLPVSPQRPRTPLTARPTRMYNR
eukprot:TRINITY_DN1243_c0_g1_i1.p1 TRINITY_DN1243_c0_g1~~TRINITY_DN1243_c0_g1_i1.p1  ORF type:complete len:481 (-),score=77.93 TRINITY_DN1243_c0_g1_i1:182-1477(-)